MAYLDANASEPLRPEARAAVIAALDVTGNPASVHHAGRAARRLLQDSRAAIAQRFDADIDGVVFTSGGTEANALAIHGFGQGRRVIIGATEHDAVRAAAPGATILPVDRDGVVRLEVLEALLREAPGLVCLMLANNETGTVQPIAEAAALCRRAGSILHVDAVQARDRFSMREIGAHSMALSSHKLGGPKGAGALLLADIDIPALLPGGGQERGRRGGTPALPSIAGFAAAALAPPVDLRPFRRLIEDAAEASGAIVLGGMARLPNTVCLGLGGVRSETQVIRLDLAGFQVSAGSACSSGIVGRSHVLTAMGLGRMAGEAIRVSLPWSVTEAEVMAFTGAYHHMAADLRHRAAVETT